MRGSRVARASLWLAAALMTSGGELHAQPQRDRAPCELLGISGECVAFEVFEDREAAAGRTLVLKAFIVPASEPEGRLEPIVFMQGGPGYSSIEIAPDMLSIFAELHRSRDFLFVDQRGTGGSHRLACQTPLPSGEESLFGSLFPADHVDACRERLSAIADLSLYTTPLAADDLAEMLRWMGHDAVNLVGQSYGTRLALVTARRHPELVRSVVVNGVAAPDVVLYLDGTVLIDRSLAWLFASCDEDPACVEEHGDLEAALRRVFARLEARPARVRALRSDGARVAVEMTRDDLAYAVRGLLYYGLVDSIPAWITRADRADDLTPLADYYVSRSRWVAGPLATGMHLTVWCSEDVPFATAADLRDADESSLMGGFLIRRYRAACDRWPATPQDPSYKAPYRSDRPTLVISGERDPVTPPELGDALLEKLTDAVHVVVADGPHVPWSTCVRAAVRAFVDAGTTRGLVHSCREPRGSGGPE